MPAMPAMKKLETTPKIEATSAMIASVLFGAAAGSRVRRCRSSSQHSRCRRSRAGSCSRAGRIAAAGSTCPDCSSCSGCSCLLLLGFATNGAVHHQRYSDNHPRERRECCNPASPTPSLDRRAPRLAVSSGATTHLGSKPLVKAVGRSRRSRPLVKAVVRGSRSKRSSETADRGGRLKASTCDRPRPPVEAAGRRPRPAVDRGRRPRPAGRSCQKTVDPKKLTPRSATTKRRKTISNRPSPMLM